MLLLYAFFSHRNLSNAPFVSLKPYIYESWHDMHYWITNQNMGIKIIKKYSITNLTTINKLLIVNLHLKNFGHNHNHNSKLIINLRSKSTL